jgi:heme-degrading monooxygenase HmoA
MKERANMATYVLVFGKLHRLEDQQAFEAAFEQVSRIVVNNVKGIVRDELIHDSKDPYSYIMLSEWENEDAWATWQRAPIHETQVGGMQQYWRGQGVKIYNTTFQVEKADGAKEKSQVA